MSIQRITRTLAAGLVLALAGPLLAGALAQATFQLTLTPSAGSAGQTITATYSSSSRDAINGFLDWGDGTEEAVTIGPVAASRSHVYAAPGTYAVRLLSVDFTVLAVRTVTIRPGLQLLNLDLQFVKPQAGKTLAVLPGAEVDVVLTYTYTGSGTMLGRWQWLPPGGPIATEEVLVNLPGTSTSGQITLTGLPTDEPGTGTVTFVVLELEPAPGGLPAIAAPIAYSVQLPPITGAKWLLVGGFQIEIRQVTNPSPQAFAGDGWLDLVVGGAAAGKRLIAFSGLPVHAEGEVVTATAGQVQALWDPPVGVKPPAIGPSELRLTKLVLSPQGGRLDGYATVHAPICFTPFQFSFSGELLAPDPALVSAAATAQFGGFGPISLVNAFSSAALQQAAQQPPAAKQPAALSPTSIQQAIDLGAVKIFVPPTPEPFGKITFANAPLQPDGDLYTSARVESPDFLLGCTGLRFKTTTPSGGLPVPAVLDLSTQQSPNLLPLAYAAHEAPPDLGPAWRGVFVSGARFAYSGPVEIENLSAPLAYAAGGYHTRVVTGPNALPAKVHGWELNAVEFEIGVVNTELVASGGTGKVFLPFFGKSVEVAIAMSPGGGWSVTTTGIVVRDFGLTGVIAGKGFIKTNGDFVFPDAIWAIGEIATANTSITADLPKESPSPGATSSPANVAAAGPAGQAIVSSTLFGAPAQAPKKASNLYAGAFYSGASTSGNSSIAQIDVATHFAGAFSFWQLVDEFGGHDAAVKALGVQLPLTNLRFNGSEAQAGQGASGVPLSGADGLRLNGYPFPSTSVRVQRTGVDRYSLVVVGKVELGAQLPAATAHYRYYVRQGADDGREILRFPVKTTLNGMTLDFPLQTVAVQGNPGTTLPGATEIAGTARVKVRDIDVEASYLFGRQATGESYWYVWSSVASDPLVGFPGVSIYEFHGGAAYRMQWPAGSFKSQPAYAASAGLTVAAGGILGTNDAGYTLHADGTFAFQASGAVTILVNGWVFTELAQGAKAAGSQPHARARIVITDQGFNFSGCVGASGSPKPPHAQVTCTGLKDLELAGVVKASGWLELNAPFKGNDYYLLIGTPKATVWVRLLDLVTAQGYVMYGRIPAANTPSGQIQTGYFTGGKISFQIKESGGGTVDFLFSSCSYGWSLQAGATFGADFALTVKPVSVSAGVDLTVSLTAGVHGCGIGLNLGAGVTLKGTITAPHSRQFSGTIKVFISPPVIPDISVTFNRTFSF
jgi:hypothetical protein